MRDEVLRGFLVKPANVMRCCAQDKEAVKRHREGLKRKKAARALARGDDGGGTSAHERTNVWRGGMGAQKTMLSRRT